MDLLSYIFPKKCLECGREGKYICDSCLRKVTYQKPICPVCERASIDGFTHVGCKTPQSLDGLVAPFRYEGVVRKAILALKYKFASEVATELAGVLCPFFHNSLFMIGTLVPIPLHWHRENWRGFNQSAEVGKLVAAKMNWKSAPDLLVRKKITTPQVELDSKKRLENVRGVFSLNPNYCLVPNAYCLLFDDVWTTGATMKEACKVLKRHGVKKVWGVAIAR
jgi:competence protein ComFC